MEILTQDGLRRREMIAGLQAHMEGLDAAAKVEPEVRHYFASGVYVREMHIPAGTLVVGKIHRSEHIAVLLLGRVTVTTEDGSETLDAPVTMVARPGTKRIAYAHTDAIWQAIHAVGDERDLAKIEARFIASDFDDLEIAADERPLIDGDNT